MHSLDFKVTNYRRDQLSRFVAVNFEEMNTNPDLNLNLHGKNNNDDPQSKYPYQLWKSGAIIANLLLKIVLLKNRTIFFRKVLLPILPIPDFSLFESNCKRLMEQKRFNDFDNIGNELKAVFASETSLERRLNIANPQHNEQPADVVVRQIKRICSKCLRGENVTKCCTHCFRYFDEECFADIHRSNTDPENLCPDCVDGATMTHTPLNCQPCDTDSDNLVTCIMHNCSVSYHSNPGCIPAGTQLLGVDRIQMICPKHNDPKPNSDQLKFCSKCADRGTSLLKCISCPLAIHSRKCLNLTSTSNKRFKCNKCKEGRVLMEGNFIYAWRETPKKWWPAKIVPNGMVPDYLLRRNQRMNERDKSGYFWIHFLETSEYQWKHQSDVFTPNQIIPIVAKKIRGEGRNNNLDAAMAVMALAIRNTA